MKERLRIALTLAFLPFPLLLLGMLPESLDTIGARALSGQITWLLLDLPAAGFAWLVAAAFSALVPAHPPLIAYPVVILCELILCWLLAGTAVRPSDPAGKSMSAAQETDSGN